jgi:hypothetical protein
MASLTAKDRISLCLFSYEDGRRCRTPRISSHPHLCFYHAQKESQSQTAEKLAKDLTYFFSGDYLSANDLNTALGRLIPAVIRGQIKPRVARTVAYMLQTLMQSTRLAQHEYINAFGTDGLRDAVHTSVTSNHDHLYPPDPNAPDDESEDESQDDPEPDYESEGEPEDAPEPQQPTPTMSVGAGLARPDSPTQPDRPTQPPPQPSAAATSAPLAAAPPTPTSTRPSPAQTQAALNIARSIFPDRANATQSQPTATTASPTPTQTAQPTNAPPTAPPPSQHRRQPGAPIREPYSVHFDHTHRLTIDGKPW